MKKEHFAYGLCGALAIKCVILPDWESTIALFFASLFAGFVLWLDFRSHNDESSKEIEELKSEIKAVSDRISQLSLKIGFKK